MADFLKHFLEGWLIVGSIILGLMVIATLWEAWRSDEGSKAGVVIVSLLIAAGIYFGGFQ